MKVSVAWVISNEAEGKHGLYRYTFHPRGVITNQIFSENQNEGSTDDSINIGGVVDFESYRSP